MAGKAAAAYLLLNFRGLVPIWGTYVVLLLPCHDQDNLLYEVDTSDDVLFDR